MQAEFYLAETFEVDTGDVAIAGLMGYQAAQGARWQCWRDTGN